MSLFTVIVGSAYRDASETNYLVEAADAKSACEYAARISAAHDETQRTVLYCFEGRVVFCPTIFDSPSFPDGPYVPPVIDLRPPAAPVLKLEISLSKIKAAALRLKLAGRNILSEIASDGSVHKLIVHVPSAMNSLSCAKLIAELGGSINIEAIRVG